MKRALLRYYGGKHKLAPWIVQHLPSHRVYVEPFAGAASVFFRKPRSYGEVLNDLSDDIITLFRVIQDDRLRKELEHKIYWTPYSRVVYVEAHHVTDDPVERALRLLIRSMMGFHSDSVNPENNISGFRNDSLRSWSLPVHNWRDYPGYLDEFAERLRGVIIEHTDAFKLFDKWSHHKDHLWYVDPPYPHATRTGANRHKYFHEMSDDDHRRLVDRLLKIKGMVVLSGYDTPLYKPLLDAGWTMKSKSVVNSMFSGRIECLWINQQAINNMR